MIARFFNSCLVCNCANGLLPPRTLKSANPFNVVHIGHIGPCDNGIYKITMVGQEARWLGVLPKQLPLTAFQSLEREWICRYHRPHEVRHDQGTQFTGDEFQEQLSSYRIRATTTTLKNPQDNAICERIHIEIVNIKCWYEGVEWKKAIHDVSFSARASHHSIYMHLQVKSYLDNIGSPGIQTKQIRDISRNAALTQSCQTTIVRVASNWSTLQTR